jgi:hypothetical protein
VGAQIGWTHLEAPGGYTLIPNPLLNKLFKSGLSDREFTVFLALATRRNLHRKKVSAKDLALFLRRDPRTVEKALLALWEKGLVERDAVGWWLAPVDGEGLSSTSQQTVQASQQSLQGEGAENALQDGLASEPEIKKENQTSEEKDPPHLTAEAVAEAEATEAETDEEHLETAPPTETHQGEGEPEERTFRTPSPCPGWIFPQDLPGALVKDGTKPLQEALKRAGLWRDFYRVFRPGFVHPGLWRAYLDRLEREALPLGEGFLLALDRTLKGALLGAVRYPAAYLDRLLQDLAPSEASPPGRASPEGGGEVEVPKDALLLLPDGRRGYFAGWTGGGARAFFEVDGVAYLVERELVLAARVVG